MQNAPIPNSIPSPPLSADELDKQDRFRYELDEDSSSTIENESLEQVEEEEEEDDEDGVRLAMSGDENSFGEQSEDTDYALFSEIIHYFNNFSTPTVEGLEADANKTKNEAPESSTTYFSVDTGLDYTPVKGDTNGKQKAESSDAKKFNYAPLRIESVRLSPVRSETENKFNKITPIPLNSYPKSGNTSTALAPNRKRMPNREFGNTTPIVLPISRQITVNNCSSDTDTSLQAPCCPVNPLKFKWGYGNSAPKFQGGRNVRSNFDYHKTYSNSRSACRGQPVNEEMVEETFVPNYKYRYNNNENNRGHMQNKKNVKFHLK